MHLDLRNDLQTISRFLKRRIREYRKYINYGPGRDDDPISMVTLGFEFDQSSWVALVFDTRHAAEPDGEWQAHIEGNSIKFPAWFKAYAAMWRSNEPMVVTKHDGSRGTIKASTKTEILANCFGEMLRAALLSLRDDGEIARLPTTKDCILCVDHHEGAFGSIDRLDGRPIKSDGRKEALAAIEVRLKSKSVAKRIEYWIAQLDCLAKGETCELSSQLFPKEPALEALKEIGNKAIVPMLTFACQWADRPQFKGDRPGKVEELPSSMIVLKVIWMANELGFATREVESLLLRFIRDSLIANQSRKLWGTNPFHAARCLSALFPKYPPPRKDDRTNALLNPEDYV